jgi:hypothetical protein
MGGWGSECPGSQAGDLTSTQPGCIRDHFFDDVFPNGVTIGDPAGVGGGNPNFYAATWTSAAAVAAFLPAGETPGELNSDVIDPTETTAGVLAGQILALTLNREFNCSGVLNVLYDDLEIACLGTFEIPGECGKFAGITVDSFLVLANCAVGGRTQKLNGWDATLSDVNFTATCLNELFNFCNAPVVTVNTDLALANENESALPKEFGIDQNYPNPFNPKTAITFHLPEASHVELEVYNLLGQRVVSLAHGGYEAGSHTVSWEAGENSSGLYLYRLKAGGKVFTRKMLLLK